MSNLFKLLDKVNSKFIERRFIRENKGNFNNNTIGSNILLLFNVDKSILIRLNIKNTSNSLVKAYLI